MSCHTFVTPVLRNDRRTSLNFDGMCFGQSSDYFPLAKGTLIVVVIVLLFAAVIFTVYLWYDIEIRIIEKHLETLSQKEINFSMKIYQLKTYDSEKQSLMLCSGMNQYLKS